MVSVGRWGGAGGGGHWGVPWEACPSCSAHPGPGPGAEHLPSAGPPCCAASLGPRAMDSAISALRPLKSLAPRKLFLLCVTSVRGFGHGDGKSAKTAPWRGPHRRCWSHLGRQGSTRGLDSRMLLSHGPQSAGPGPGGRLLPRPLSWLVAGGWWPPHCVPSCPSVQGVPRVSLRRTSVGAHPNSPF